VQIYEFCIGFVEGDIYFSAVMVIARFHRSRHCDSGFACYRQEKLHCGFRGFGWIGKSWRMLVLEIISS
jgi:hypothetical protein